jgi:hypothetical protein
MAGVRIFAVISLGVLAIYHVTRILATQCTGVRCDAYIANVFLLALAVILAALTGVLGIVAAVQQWQGGWQAVLIGCTLIGVVVPLAGLAVFRNSPDAYIAAATTATALVPLVGLVYSFAPPRLRHQR